MRLQFTHLKIKLRRNLISIHIGAEKGQIAPTVLMPGDPKRAKFFAETLLEDATCFNEVRGMLGYTGFYKGIPFFSIYMTELVQEYGVQTVIRVGTCGALQPDLQLGDIVLAMSASTDSSVNRLRFGREGLRTTRQLRTAEQGTRRRGGPRDAGAGRACVFRRYVLR